MSKKNPIWCHADSTAFTVLIAVALTASCTAIGPKTIPRDQFDYGAAIASSWKEQLLFNIVGLRYLEAPVFVNVSSVINSYSLEGSVNFGAGANTSFTGDDTLTIGGEGKYADRPTITYTPIAGQTGEAGSFDVVIRDDRGATTIGRPSRAPSPGGRRCRSTWRGSCSCPTFPSSSKSRRASSSATWTSAAISVPRRRSWPARPVCRRS